MKTSKIFVVLIVLISIGLFFDACKKDDDNVNDMNQTSQDDAFVEDAFDDLSNQANLYENGTLKSIVTYCTPTVTITPNVPDSFPRHIVIDFGESCEGYYGRIRAGKIIIDQTARFNEEGAVRTFQLDSFYIDGYHIEGTRTVTCDGRNDDDFLQYTVQLVGGKVTTPDGLVIERESQRVREWIAGEDTPLNRWDDEWRISGTATGVNRFGYSYTAQVTTPLIFDMSCKWKIVQGVLTITSEAHVVTIDYGNGDCDNEIIVTRDGVETIVHLKR